MRQRHRALDDARLAGMIWLAMGKIETHNFIGIVLYVRNGMTKKFYAHSLDGKPPSEWQLLEEHLKNVA